MYPEITLKSGREAALLRGHPWVFSGAIAGFKGKPADGDVVLAKDAKGHGLALGFFNSRTDIAFRVLTRETGRVIDAGFWKGRVSAACQLRERIINANTSAYRLINAEGDGFITTAGMEKQWQNVLDALIDHLGPARIYEQSAGRSRGLEGLKERKGFLYGDNQKGVTRVTENGYQFEVDFVGGQKTGFFLDQRVNRERLGALARGMTVLNCFCYTGAFSVYAAAGGAKKVVSLDISKPACAAASEHLKINGFSPDVHPVIEADVFEYLHELQGFFDLIILDPPAFAKTKRDVPKASRGYKEINMQAIKHLDHGGMLATFSCSNFMEEDLFYKIVQGAARDAMTNVQLLARLEAGPDHPLALGHPEGRYLKGLLLRRS
ncbi:MAG: 23S rRNA (cytosine(1962)-C(5))-methyltransferase RlmI [Deltaproteobacteria bacterium HGW-Deltaproteobacteria-5]|nr:MAG: 23S rRNA (cytosine(1962)-C(5))-methyltransferase RlmI [Deltaproteobacteria bacterium HGW-Deltaproteobacteria-5]